MSGHKTTAVLRLDPTVLVDNPKLADGLTAENRSWVYRFKSLDGEDSEPLNFMAVIKSCESISDGTAEVELWFLTDLPRAHATLGASFEILYPQRIGEGEITRVVNTEITIVHTESGMCLTTRRFDGWRDVQDCFDDYKTSLGPFDQPELDTYLAEEYPAVPAHEIWDFRLLRMQDSFTWSPNPSPQGGDGLKLGTVDGDSLRLAIAGYQFPDAEDIRKRDSWYMVEGSATLAGEAWDFRWQALTCDTPPLICHWLFELASWLEFGDPDAQAPDPPWLIEPCIQFTEAKRINGRVHLTVGLSHEFSLTGRKAESILLRATAEELRRAAVDFAATIAVFPETPQPSRPAL